MGSPTTGKPPEMTSVRPLTIPSVPSVTMNGGMRRVAIIRPFAQPHRAPHKTPARMPAGTDPVSTIVIVPSTPEHARMEPTDRSMPPDTMTSVMPSAMMLITAVCRMTLARFVPVRK